MIISNTRVMRHLSIDRPDPQNVDRNSRRGLDGEKRRGKVRRIGMGGAVACL